MSKMTDQALTDRAQLLIHWQSVLCNGRVRPDDPTIKERKLGKENSGTPCCNETGVVRDSGEFRDLIIEINRELKDILI